MFPIRSTAKLLSFWGELQCFRNLDWHGKDAIVEEVLDWRPSDYFTVSTLLPIPGAPKIMMTHAFQDRTNGATHIEMRVAKPKPKDKAFVDQAGAKFKENIYQGD
jgi:hypothetical protein